jgi:hypothetical protein
MTASKNPDHGQSPNLPDHQPADADPRPPSDAPPDRSTLPKPTISLVEASPRDVLLGRGRGNGGNSGNQMFQALIIENLARYHSAANRPEKTQIIKEILVAISKAGGRFLKPDKVRGGLVKISDAEARTKVGQAIRYRTVNQKDFPGRSTASVPSTSEQRREYLLEFGHSDGDIVDRKGSGLGLRSRGRQENVLAQFPSRRFHQQHLPHPLTHHLHPFGRNIADFDSFRDPDGQTLPPQALNLAERSVDVVGDIEPRPLPPSPEFLHQLGALPTTQRSRYIFDIDSSSEPTPRASSHHIQEGSSFVRETISNVDILSVPRQFCSPFERLNPTSQSHLPQSLPSANILSFPDSSMGMALRSTFGQPSAQSQYQRFASLQPAALETSNTRFNQAESLSPSRQQLLMIQQHQEERLWNSQEFADPSNIYRASMHPNSGRIPDVDTTVPQDLSRFYRPSLPNMQSEAGPETDYHSLFTEFDRKNRSRPL